MLEREASRKTRKEGKPKSINRKFAKSKGVGILPEAAPARLQRVAAG